MPLMQTTFVSAALARLRRGVNVCCWVIAAALLAQVLVWCFATFMDVRYEALGEDAKPGMIITPHDDDKPLIVTSSTVISGTTSTAEAPKNAVDLNRVTSKYDIIMAKTTNIAKGAGTFAVVVMLPLLLLGVLLGAGSVTPGVENTASAFTWAVVAAGLILPVGPAIGLPWNEGALSSYEHMMQQVDLAAAKAETSMGAATFYARFALLPLACVAGIAMIGLRFSAGVFEGIIPKENLRLDPVLEKEAANVKAGSLHGGRAGNALRMAGVATTPAAPAAPRKPVAAAPAAPAPSMTQLSAGEAPRRLI